MFFWKHGGVLVPELLTAAELPARRAAYCRGQPFTRVLVRGDHKSRLGSTVVALDAVRLAGITQVSVETLVTPSGR